jgi:hypothetical protein
MNVEAVRVEQIDNPSTAERRRCSDDDRMLPATRICAP